MKSYQAAALSVLTSFFGDGLTFSSGLKKIRQLVNRLFNSPELDVVWKRDRQGNLYLEIYDSVTQKRYCFASEQEARIWIEWRYSRPSDESS